MRLRPFSKNLLELNMDNQIKAALTGRCNTCGSDDLMRLLAGDGCEYGTDWVVKSLLREELESVDIDAAFENSVREIYPETVKVAWLSFDTVTVIRELDRVSWDCACSEWENTEADEGNIISFDNGIHYYLRTDIEEYIEKESML
jgi:hypothetical protein